MGAVTLKMINFAVSSIFGASALQGFQRSFPQKGSCLMNKLD